MSYHRQGRAVTWHGVPRTGGPRMYAIDDQDSLLHHLLHDFEDVFAEPRGLPQVCDHDHRIHLDQGAQPMAVRPYRYP